MYRTPGSGPTTQNEESVAASAAVTFNVEIFFAHTFALTDNEGGFGWVVFPEAYREIGLRMCFVSSSWSSGWFWQFNGLTQGEVPAF